jgi:NADH-quinone oxidoreductase subunit N
MISHFVTPNFMLLIPEMFLLGMICVILMAGLFVPVSHRASTSYLLTQGTLLGAAILSFKLMPSTTMISFGGGFILDKFAVLVKIVIYGVCFFSFCYAYYDLKRLKLPSTEFFVISLLSILGMMVIVSAHSLLTVYMGVELLSFPLYVLVAMKKSSHKASEAAMKYFVTGALASGFLLYGLSLVYGVAHTLAIEDIVKVLAHTPFAHHSLIGVGLVFIVAGLLFKLGAVPFHMWLPDVYQGAPTIVTLFVASAPKLAAFALLVRVLVQALPAYAIEWQTILIVLALLSMTVGNLLAIVQKSIKRMFAYSSIAHVGYLLLGLIAGSAQGYAAALFYTIVYVMMVMGGFAILALMSYDGADVDNLNDLKGLNTVHPWFAFLMLLLVFSMAGIPPTIGFFAKLSVLYSLIIAKNLVWLAAVAILLSVLGAYYYLRVVRLMYFEIPERSFAFIRRVDVNIAISVNALLVLFLGMFPSQLIDLCRGVFV